MIATDPRHFHRVGTKENRASTKESMFSSNFDSDYNIILPYAARKRITQELNNGQAEVNTIGWKAVPSACEEQYPHLHSSTVLKHWEITDEDAAEEAARRM
jgi:hypothetical protein